MVTREEYLDEARKDALQLANSIGQLINGDGSANAAESLIRWNLESMIQRLQLAGVI